MVALFFAPFFDATLMTLGLALSSLAFGLILATVFALGELSKLTLLRYITTTLVTTLRGLPELLVVFFIFFGTTHVLFLLTDEFIEIPPFTAGTLALGLIYAAYASQTLRGALMAIPAGQTEAAKALGINTTQTFFKVVLPQAWRHALPGLGNQWLVLLKDTALIALIGVTELLHQAQVLSSKTYEPFTWYLTSAIIYLVITLISQHLLDRMKRKANQHIRAAKI